jgi:hypothetical protein
MSHYPSHGSSKIALRSIVNEPVKQETTKQLTKLQEGEIEELRNALRYAEFILSRTRQEKLELEEEIQRNDLKLAEVHHLAQSKEDKCT